MLAGSHHYGRVAAQAPQSHRDDSKEEEKEQFFLGQCTTVFAADSGVRQAWIFDKTLIGKFLNCESLSFSDMKGHDYYITYL